MIERNINPIEYENGPEIPFEKLPRDERESLIVEKLVELVDYSQSNSPYYKEAYKNSPKITSLEDFSCLPVLTRDSFVKASSNGDLFTTPKEEGGLRITMSGGTSAQAKYLYREPKEITSYVEKAAGYLSRYVIGKYDIVSNHVASGNLWASFLVFQQQIELTGATSLPFGTSSEETVARVWAEQRPTVLWSMPSATLDMLHKMKEKGINMSPFKDMFHTMVYGGEHLNSLQKQKLSQLLGIKKFVSFYSSTDTGAISQELCDAKPGLMHLLEDVNYTQIVDIDDLENGNPVPHEVESEKMGALVVTNLHYKRAPVIRFVIGDVGVIRPADCGCGIKSPLLEISGRIDDQLNINSEKWPATAALKEITSAYSDLLTGTAQFVLTKKGLYTKLTVILESNNPIEAKKALTPSRLFELIATSAKDYNVLPENICGNNIEYEVNCVHPNTIDRTSTGKVKLVIWEI